MTMISSYGGPDSNSYVSLTDANSFLGTVLLGAQSSIWTSLTTPQKEASLIQATRDIDAKQYVGRRYTYDQALEFPRQVRSAFPYNRTATETLTLDVTQKRMQSDVKQATCYQAIWLAMYDGLSIHQLNQALGIQRITDKTGPITETVAYGKTRTSQSSKFSPQALPLLQDWITGRRIFRA